MSDVFREVDEALREDRAQVLWKRYGRIAVTVMALVVAATAGVVYWRDNQATRQAAMADRVVGAMALAASEPGEAANSLAILGEETDGTQQVMAALLEAAVRQELGEDEDALRLLAGVAEGQGDAVWRDLASLQAALQATRADVDAGTDISALASSAGPWQHAAQEITAILALQTGDVDRAREIFQSLADDDSAPAGIRTRAGEMVSALDG